MARYRQGRRGSDEGSGFRRLFAWVLAGLLVVGCTFQRQPDAEEGADSLGLSLGEAVETMLHASAASWNAGDLEGFMDDYWRSGELSFSGSGGVTRGWEEVRGRYLESYWAPGAERDSLRFEDIEVTPLGEEHALALGRYVLYRPEGDTVTSSGHFSLVLRRLEGQWRIIHDHTSAADEGEEEGEGGG